MRNIFLGFLLGVVAVGSFFTGARYGSRALPASVTNTETKTILNEESTVTKVVESATPSVVTVSISKTKSVIDPLDYFGGFGNFFDMPRSDTKTQNIEQDIGTGFIIDKSGLIATNKHVVSDTNAKYKVVLSKDGKDEVLEVKNIYRDPQTDFAILKIDKNDLQPLPLGDSSKLKAGQLVIAIGTALGEFRSTVTTGVISGLGRGISAGSPFEGSEKLDNVIQTDAAINPGNSGGPLLNSAGEAIGVNTAVSSGGQNIGFAIPINMVKESIANFNSTGQFERPLLGVTYRMITKRSALLNDVPQGAYVQEVVEDSAAKKAGVLAGDIIVELDGKKLNTEDTQSLGQIINKKKIGDEVKIKLYRDSKELELTAKLDKAK